MIVGNGHTVMLRLVRAVRGGVEVWIGLVVIIQCSDGRAGVLSLDLAKHWVTGCNIRKPPLFIVV